MNRTRLADGTSPFDPNSPAAHARSASLLLLVVLPFAATGCHPEEQPHTWRSSVSLSVDGVGTSFIDDGWDTVDERRCDQILSTGEGRSSTDNWTVFLTSKRRPPPSGTFQLATEDPYEITIHHCVIPEHGCTSWPFDGIWFYTASSGTSAFTFDPSQTLTVEASYLALERTGPNTRPTDGHQVELRAVVDLFGCVAP